MNWFSIDTIMLNISQLNIDSLLTGAAVTDRLICRASSLVGIGILTLVAGTTVDNLTIATNDRVLIVGNTDLQHVTRITPVADTGGSLNGTYWQFDTKSGSLYYVWYSVIGQAVINPSIPGRTGIQVSISINSNVTAVLSATQTALSALTPTPLSSSVNSGTFITITDALNGMVPRATANTSGFTITTITDGTSITDRGIWIVGSTPTRSSDCDSGTKFGGVSVYIRSGLYYGNTVWRCTNNLVNDIVGTNTLNFYNENYVITRVRESKSNGTNGGTATAGISTRLLNTLSDSWGGNETTPSPGGITLDIPTGALLFPQGRYMIWATASAYRVGSHQIALEVGTDINTWTNYLTVGTSEISPNATNSLLSRSSLCTTFNITSTSSLRIRHYFQLSRNTDGLGVAVGGGFNEIYAELFIIKYSQFNPV